MTVKEQIDFWNSLPEEEQNKEVTVCGLTVEEVMKLRIESEKLKKEREKMKCCGNCIHCYEEKYAGLCCNLFDGEKYVPSIEKRNCDKWEPDKN